MCDVTTLSRYRKEKNGPYFEFIKDEHEGCNLDTFKEDFARQRNITEPSSCDALFIWEDWRDNADKETKLESEYSGESLLFVEFKHAPIFRKTSEGKIDFLHEGQNGGIDDGCYAASIQKKLEDSCIILMQMSEDGKGTRLQFKDCRRMNAAFIVYNTPEGEKAREHRRQEEEQGKTRNTKHERHRRLGQVGLGINAVRFNQKKVFRGLENYLYRKVLLMPDTVFERLLGNGSIYINKD